MTGVTAGYSGPADLSHTGLWIAAWPSIARTIQQTSDEELLVEHEALYPALQRTEERGWISAKWGVSSNNSKAWFYSLTAAGRKQLVRSFRKNCRFGSSVDLLLRPIWQQAPEKGRHQERCHQALRQM
jgi:DNA-binding PadR family transcriptional regulator